MAIYRKKLLIIFILFSVVFVSCEDTFEKDISSTKVTLNTPQDGYSFYDPNILFWWEPIEGASKYNIQIILIDTSQNNALINLVTDSNITDNKFLQTLSPGSYKWGVKAYNGGYQTEYTYLMFYIDSTLDLSNIYLVLSTPSDNFITNDTTFTFSWEDLYSADYYSWDLRSPDENGNFVNGITDIITNSLQVDISDEGTYAWTVYAHNNISNTDSKKLWRTITIDRTKPNVPDLILPINNDTLYTADLISSKIKFLWTPPNDDGTALTYTITIASDTNFTNELLNYNTNDTTYYWTPDNSFTKFFWKMTSSDAAGNECDYYTEVRRFWYINQ